MTGRRTARLYEPDADEVTAFAAWVKERPPAVRALAERFAPWELWWLEPPGQYVWVASYAEDGTVRVVVTGRYNVVLCDSEVFGVDSNNLKPVAELPPVVNGTLMTPEEVDANVDAIRVAVRPDLWAMDDAGKAVRKQ